jgi:mannose-1-phosphate guanylyltransferase
MKAIILAGGMGLRLRPLTVDRPKSLVEVNGRPIAEHQLKQLASEKLVDGVVFACGYKWERIREKFGSQFAGLKVEYSVEEEPLGTGGAIRKALPHAGDDSEVVIMNGDVITDLPLKRMVDEHRRSVDAAATMLVVPYRSSFGVVRIDKLKTVRGFEEKPEFPDVWINGGIYVASTRKFAANLPERGDVERTAFPRFVAHGELMSFPYYGDWWYIDSMKDLKEVEESLKPGAV